MTCRHHWDIKVPEGPVSLGVCRYCGEVREFQNSRDDYGPVGRAPALYLGKRVGAYKE